MTLVPVSAEEISSLLAGTDENRIIAAGWPHENSAAGLGFVHSGGWQFLIVDAEGRIAGECGTKTAPPRAAAIVRAGWSGRRTVQPVRILASSVTSAWV